MQLQIRRIGLVPPLSSLALSCVCQRFGVDCKRGRLYTHMCMYIHTCVRTCVRDEVASTNDDAGMKGIHKGETEGHRAFDEQMHIQVYHK